MKEITTSTGFSVLVDERITDDWEMIELIAGTKENDPAAVIGLVDKLMGKDGTKALKEHVRGEDGIVRTSDMMREVSEIFQGVASKK